MTKVSMRINPLLFFLEFGLGERGILLNVVLCCTSCAIFLMKRFCLMGKYCIMLWSSFCVYAGL